MQRGVKGRRCFIRHIPDCVISCRCRRLHRTQRGAHLLQRVRHNHAFRNPRQGEGGMGWSGKINIQIHGDIEEWVLRKRHDRRSVLNVRLNPHAGIESRQKPTGTIVVGLSIACLSRPTV